MLMICFHWVSLRSVEMLELAIHLVRVEVIRRVVVKHVAVQMRVAKEEEYEVKGEKVPAAILEQRIENDLPQIRETLEQLVALQCPAMISYKS